jgi:hypothetical protein
MTNTRAPILTVLFSSRISLSTEVRASLMFYCSTIPQTPEQRGWIAAWLNNQFMP